jgi:hypothetical protein
MPPLVDPLAWPLLVQASGTCRCSCCSFERPGDDCTPADLGANTSMHCAEGCTGAFCASVFPDSCPTGPSSGGSAGLGGHLFATCGGLEDGMARFDDATPAELKALLPVALLVLFCMCSWCCLCRWCCLRRRIRSEHVWADTYPPAFSTAYNTMPMGQPVTACPVYPPSTRGADSASGLLPAVGSVIPAPTGGGHGSHHQQGSGGGFGHVVHTEAGV